MDLTLFAESIRRSSEFATYLKAQKLPNCSVEQTNHFGNTIKFRATDGTSCALRSSSSFSVACGLENKDYELASLDDRGNVVKILAVFDTKEKVVEEIMRLHPIKTKGSQGTKSIKLMNKQQQQQQQ